MLESVGANSSRGANRHPKKPTATNLRARNLAGVRPAQVSVSCAFASVSSGEGGRNRVNQESLIKSSA